MSRTPLPPDAAHWAAWPAHADLHSHPHSHPQPHPHPQPIPPDPRLHPPHASDSASSPGTDDSSSPLGLAFNGYLPAPETSHSSLSNCPPLAPGMRASSAFASSTGSHIGTSTTPHASTAHQYDPPDGDSYLSAPPNKRRRGAAACTTCRRLKMRCTGGENGPPCQRCRASGHECVFEESSRAKKGNKAQRAAAMAESLHKMEQTLAIVLQSIGSGQTLPDSAKAALTDAAASSNSSTHANTSRNATTHPPTVSRPPSQDSTSSPPPALAMSRLDAPQLSRQPSSLDRTQRSLPPAVASSTSPARTVEPSIPPLSRPESRPGISDAWREDQSPLSEHLEASSSRSPFEGDASGERHRRLKNILNRCSQYTPQGSAERGEDDPGDQAPGPSADAVPGNPLDPLGLLAEASLNTQKWPHQSSASATGESPHQPESQRQGLTPSETTNGVQPLAVNDSGADRSMPLGIANQSYFRPSFISYLSLRKFLIERELPPTLLDDGVVTEDEATDLFRIFFQSCIHYALLLDPAWHTPKFVRSRSPFLFTVIICIAAQFYAPRPELHAKALDYAKNCAFTVLENGLKSVEIVQAFLLMSLWGESSPNIEQDTAWIFSGLAIRIATDINLDRRAKVEIDVKRDPADPVALERERDELNRTRTWYSCYVIDRMFASQTGKAYIVREDQVIRNVRTWCMQRFSQPWDVGIAALVELYRIQSRQMDFIRSSAQSAFNVETDFASVLRIFNRQLDEWRQTWRFEDLVHQYRNRNAATASSVIYTADGFRERPEEGSQIHPLNAAPASDPTVYPARQAAEAEASALLDALRTTKDDDGKQPQLAPPPNAFIERSLYFLVRQGTMRYHYTVLFLNSLGLQRVLDHPDSADVETPAYYFRCKGAAMSICRGAAMLGLDLRYAPDSEFLMIAYAGVFLLKLVRPVFAGYSNEEDVIGLVRRLASFLTRIAVNERHTPYLYGTFLYTLLQGHDEQERPHASSDGLQVSKAATLQPGAPSGAQPLDEGNTSAAPNLPMDAGQGTLDPGSAAAYPAAVQLLTGIPFVPAGEETIMPGMAPGTTAWQQQVEMPPEQVLTDSFWSSLLPPGFEGLLQDTMGSSETMLPPQLRTASTPSLASGSGPGPAVSQQTRESSEQQLASTHPQNWFSFPAATPGGPYSDSVTGTAGMVLPSSSLGADGR